MHAHPVACALHSHGATLGGALLEHGGFVNDGSHGENDGGILQGRNRLAQLFPVDGRVEEIPRRSPRHRSRSTSNVEHTTSSSTHDQHDHGHASCASSTWVRTMLTTPRTGVDACAAPATRRHGICRCCGSSRKGHASAATSMIDVCVDDDDQARQGISASSAAGTRPERRRAGRQGRAQAVCRRGQALAWHRRSWWKPTRG